MKKAWNEFTSSLSSGWNYLRSIKIEKYSLLIILVFVLSLLDAVFTLAWIKAGLAVEANPLLRKLLDHGEFSFLGTKIFLTGVGCSFLFWVKDKSRAARFTIWTIFILYCVVTGYHLLGALHSIDHTHLPDFVNDFLVWAS